MVSWVKVLQLYRTYSALTAMAAAQAFPKAKQLEGGMDRESVQADTSKNIYTICSMCIGKREQNAVKGSKIL